MYVAQEMIALNDLFDPDNTNNKFNRIFLADRNKIWIPRLVEKMKTEQVFLAVGCAHLFGKTGLVTLLRKQGYTVEGVPNK
ncbi:TraB family protein [compost metagenome]